MSTCVSCYVDHRVVCLSRCLFGMEQVHTQVNVKYNSVLWCRYQVSQSYAKIHVGTVGDSYQFGDSTLLFETSWFSRTSRFFGLRRIPVHQDSVLPRPSMLHRTCFNYVHMCVVLCCPPCCVPFQMSIWNEVGTYIGKYQVQQCSAVQISSVPILSKNLSNYCRRQISVWQQYFVI